MQIRVDEGRTFYEYLSNDFSEIYLFTLLIKMRDQQFCCIIDFSPSPTIISRRQWVQTTIE